MRNRRWGLALVGVVVVVALLGGIGAQERVDDHAGPGDGRAFFLSVPAFAQAAPAGQFPASEAGISAYFKVDQSVDLDKARSSFRGIQSEGDDYLIGIVELEGLPEELWPHLYVSSDGWFLAYYSKYDPASKLMPWDGYSGGPVNTTTLRNALSKFTTEVYASMQVAYAFVVAEETLAYYDFRYPEATAFVLAADSILPNEADSLRYAIPSAALVYEGSWAHFVVDNHGYSGDKAQIVVDTVVLHEGFGGSYYAAGVLDEQFLRKEMAHEVIISKGRNGYSGGAVAFVYR